MAQTNCTMHLIANTHWDREWHFTVEQTRPLLRDKIKAILDALDDDPDFFWQVLRPAVYDKGRERTLRWDEPGTLFHLCDEASYRGDYALLDPPVRLIADERLAKGVSRPGRL